MKPSVHVRGAALQVLLLLAVAQWPALAEETPPEEAYAGDETCLFCHEDLEGYYETRHAKLFTEQNARTAQMRRGCEACHGPGAAHADEGGGIGVGNLVSFRAESPEAISKENAVCLSCHAGGKHLYWEGSAHQSRDLACTSCHALMEKVSEHAQLAKPTQLETCGSCHLIQKARQFRNARMPLREGHMQCSSCHNPHGSVADALVAHTTVNDGCLSCHADKRGPFLWEHPPVSEDCLNCHVPHGSVRKGMLKQNPPRLCQQCHIPGGHPAQPHDPDSRFVVGGACLQCHLNIHGSNHPSGFLFSR
jgi:DmsE family decaheme c-type cytochrome